MPALAHFGIGLAVKRFFPQIPLWVLLISVMFLDILSFIFIFAIWISHGLFMAALWSIIAMVVTGLITMILNLKKEQIKEKKWRAVNLQISITIGFIVFSHWILDFIGWPMSFIGINYIGTPVLFDDALNFGLGVYSTWFGALLMDIGVFVVGLAVYLYYVKKIKKK